ncbi:hypothetical protein UA08_05574 [Talaromyces atroroseus]|uniref:Pentatricopeptide repeat protein n=1 Tax=Talaromyces atroroseus TaxID=1441469 RepID=A0A225AWQ2_TALAT|nr:hypothetical protein UA08_05574 [Talaromyces atroroseus]OKL58875.1 hypothetical protein UA08_05574 [Talaromyces atroroseus]
MITRGKSRLRRGNLSTLIDSVVVPTTNEPLHFLYPRWARSGLLLSRLYHIRPPLFSPRRPKPSGAFSEPPRRHAAPDTQSCRWLSHEGSAPKEDKADIVSDASDLSPVSESAQYGVLESESLNSVHGDLPGQDNHETHPGGPFEDVHNDSSSTEKVVIRRTLSKGMSINDKKRLAAERIRSRKGVGLFGEQQTYVDAAKLGYRKYVNKWRQAVTGKRSLPPHWTEIMAILEKFHVEMPVTPKSTVHKEILVREEVVVQLSGDTTEKENIWFIEIRNGCRLRVLDAVESEGILRKVVLSGTRRAVELVEKQIKQVDEQQVAAMNLPLDQRGSQMARSWLPIIPSILAYKKTGQPLPLIRGHWDDKIITKGDPLARRPKFTDIRGFAQYVEQLITARPNLPTKPGDPPYINGVAQRLRFIFTEPGNRIYLSTYALNRALTFLCEHEYLDSARHVFRASQTVATVNSYNIFFRSTARRQDFFFFMGLLSEMGKSGMQPNGATWVAFLESLLSPGPRTQVIERMTELGFLKDRRVELDVVQNNIGMILFPHLRKGLGIKSFLEELEQSHGHEIISTYTLNLILEQVTPRRDSDLLREIFECFKKYGLTPDSRTFNLAFNHFRGMDMAHFFLSSYIYHHEYALSPLNYEKMFRIAITSNLYNTCRVIWRYACLKGATTPLMRHIVRSSLAGANKGRARDQDQIEYHIGSIVIGLEYLRKVQVHGEMFKMAPGEVELGRNVVAHLIHTMEPACSERMKLATQLVNDDVEQGPQRQSVESFNMMLHAATTLDKETQWHSKHADHPAMNRRPTVDILKEVIAVPIR